MDGDATMTLQELQAETLVEKNRRLRQAKCKHPADAVFTSTVVSPTGTYINSGCLDCGKSWHRAEARDKR